MTQTFTATQDHPIRIDLFLVDQCSLSRHAIQKMVTNQKITINGAYPKNRTLVNKGDVISVTLPPQKPLLTPTPLALNILFEDEHIIVVNKPPSLIVHPGAGNSEPTLVEALLAHTSLAPSSAIRPGIVHRLDKDTSGVLIAAKQTSSYTHLVKAFSERLITKTYHAIVEGTPSLQTIDKPISRNPKKRICMAISPLGKEAVTHITHVQNLDRYSLVTLHPITGRTHQIRVHLASIHAPIIGDQHYAPKRLHNLSSRQLLHASELTFTHPISTQKVTIQSPLPLEMKNWIEKFRQTCI